MAFLGSPLRKNERPLFSGFVLYFRISLIRCKRLRPPRGGLSEIRSGVLFRLHRWVAFIRPIAGLCDLMPDLEEISEIEFARNGPA